MLALIGCQGESDPNSADSRGDRQRVGQSVPETTLQNKTALQRANELIRGSRFDEAESLLREALIESPEDLDSVLLLARLEARKQHFNQAASLLLDFIEQHPETRDRLETQAAGFIYQSGDYLKSIQLLQGVVQRNPRQPEIRRRLAETLNSRGFRFDANEHLRVLCSQTTLSLRELIGLTNPTLTWVTFGEKPDINDTDLVTRSGVLNVVAALRYRGDVREALEVLQQSPLLKQRHPAAVAMRGWLLATNQQTQQLRAWAANAERSCRRYPAYWMGIGNLLMHDAPDAAAGCWVEALRREPNCLEAATGLVQALKLAKRDDEAQRAEARKLDIESSQLLAYQIGSEEQLHPEMSTEMGRLLESMGRPMESLAWQETLFAIGAPNSSQLASIRAYKQRLRSTDPNGQDESVIVCGLDRASLPDPAAAIAKLRSSEQPLRPKPPPSSNRDLPKPQPPVFRNVASQRGIHFRHLNSQRPVTKEFRLYEALGSGVACLDFDLDGNLDLYFAQAGCTPPDGTATETDALYRGLANRFRDVSLNAGITDRQYTQGVTCGDWNQDGLPDVFIGNLGVNRLLINQGDGSFRDVTENANITDSQWQRGMETMSVAIADVTGDALPDLVEINYVDDKQVFAPIEYNEQGQPIILPGPNHFRHAIDRVFETTAEGRLKTSSFGKQDDAANTGLGLLITDLDGQPGNEVFVANDQNENQLWKRRDDGWTNKALGLGVALGTGGKPFACMGIAVNDFDRNGRPDLHVTNFVDECSNLFMQQTSGAFLDRAIAFELDQSTVKMVGFGTQAIDYDNNTTADLVIGNGHIEDYRNKGKAFRMPPQILGRDGNRFVEMNVGGDRFWNTSQLSRAVAVADWNRDGRVDVVMTDLLEPVALLENRTESKSHWLQLELVGRSSERDAVGTNVTVLTDSLSQFQVSQTGDGYLCKNEAVLFFGLGEQESVDAITVRWPSGSTQRFEDLNADQRVLLIEGQSQPWRR
jgi:tetratricopeptide (TPR) repeat protein